MFSIIKIIYKFPLSKCNLQYISRCLSEVTQNATSLQTASQSTVQQSFGQPTPQTHAHILKKDEIVAGIQIDEFKRRRSKLYDKISKCGHEMLSASMSQIVIIPSASKVYMSDKIPYVFRQNTDFLYFTGCQEPDSILLLVIKDNSHSSILFMRQKDAHAELWDGPRTGVDAALSLFQVEQVFPIIEFERFLISFFNEHKKCNIWYDNENVIQPELDKKLTQLIKLSNTQRFNCPKTLIHQVRIIKSPAEINLMKGSCEIASKAISETIKISKSGMSEHQLFATVDYECRMRGAEFLAYPPVVAGGKNANTIHYISNNQIINDKEMVLMDAGCEYHGYTSDITRTWPINGSFTPEQKMLYEIVLDVQKILIDKLKEMPSLDIVYHEMCYLLGKRLQEECLIPKSLNGNKLLAAAYTYCPHHVSHYLGMDVHDTSKISRSIHLQPGMIVTVEPGIYIHPTNNFAPREFHHLGIRIEDDVLIEESGPIILSQICPKEIADIEALAQQNQV